MCSSSVKPLASATPPSDHARIVRRRGPDRGASVPNRSTAISGAGSARACSVVGRLVEIADRRERRIEAGQRGIAQQRVSTQLHYAATFEQECRPHPVGGDQLLHRAEEPDPVGGRQWLAVSADLGQRHVDVVADGADDAAHERRMQQRHIGRGHVRDRRPIADRGQPGRQTLQRSPPLPGVLHDLDGAAERWQLLPRRPHHDNRTVH